MNLSKSIKECNYLLKELQRKGLTCQSINSEEGYWTIILNNKDIITFQETKGESLEEAFHTSLNEYLEME